VRGQWRIARIALGTVGISILSVGAMCMGMLLVNQVMFGVRLVCGLPPPTRDNIGRMVGLLMAGTPCCLVGGGLTLFFAFWTEECKP
jgi:hypothetical protein